MLCDRVKLAATDGDRGRDFHDDRVTTSQVDQASPNMRLNVPISVAGWGRFFTRWDVIAVLLILGLLVFLAEASRHLLQPLAELQLQPVSLDPANLPEYAARTTLRMLIAMALSLLFTFTYATLAAKNKQAERCLLYTSRCV